MSDKNDLTRIENISSFSHEDSDEELDQLLEYPPDLSKADTDIDTGSDPGTDTLTVTDTDTDTDTDTATDTASFADTDTDTATDTASFADTDVESETEVDTNTEFGDDTSFESDDEFGDDTSAFSQDEEIFEITEDVSKPGAFDDSSESDQLASTETSVENEKGEEEGTKENLVQPPASPPKARPQEDFSEVSDFAENFTYGKIPTTGNPPYSVIIKNIKFSEDADEILNVLIEHGLANGPDDEMVRQGLDNGSLLISQISEYSAIYLAHAFRRLNVEILSGLSEELHQSPSYTQDFKGLISKANVMQNKAESLSDLDSLEDISSLILATTPTIEGYSIKKYLGVVTSSTTIAQEELERVELDQNENKIEQSEQEIYGELAENLRPKAFRLKGNAIVNINYQITPITDEQYKITCTGNVVWAGRLKSI